MQDLFNVRIRKEDKVNRILTKLKNNKEISSDEYNLMYMLLELNQVFFMVFPRSIREMFPLEQFSLQLPRQAIILPNFLYPYFLFSPLMNSQSTILSLLLMKLFPSLIVILMSWQVSISSPSLLTSL